MAATDEILVVEQLFKQLKLKLISQGDGSFALAVGTSPTTVGGAVAVVADPDTRVVASTTVTTHATPGNDTIIDIPDTAKGFILEAQGSLVRWNIGAAAAAIGTQNTPAAGGRAKAETEVVRVLAAGTARQIHLRSLIASVVCYLEFWG